MTTDIRPLTGRPEYEACVALQREIWGPEFVDVVPATILMVAQRVGGIASGAFDDDRTLLGFVFGISGLRDGRPAHWSDMLAVRPEARRHGLGRRLKLHQRERLLVLGIERVFWTFDPLVARNARLNLVSLGARPVEYVTNMYGDTGSRLHDGRATDRIVVEWRLRDPAVEATVAGHRPDPPAEALDSPVLDLADPGDAGGDPIVLPEAAWIRVALPLDVDGLEAAAPGAAARWQRHLRRVLGACLDERREIVSLVDGPNPDRCCYLVRRPEAAR